MRFSYYLQRFLEKIGLDEGRAYLKTRKIRDFESWLYREPLTTAIITFDPKDCLNTWTEMSVSIDAFRLSNTRGRWRKNFTWTAKAVPTLTKEGNG